MFSRFFGKKPSPPVQETTHTENIIKNESMSLTEQIQWLKDHHWVGNYNVNNKNIIIMDDREEIISSVIDDLVSLDQSPDFNLDSFNILTFSSKMAGFNVIEMLEKAPDIHIHYALLDIILGGKKSIDGKRTMVDGVDVAIEILEKFPTADILFFSGCIIENSNDPLNFKNKFDNYMGEDMNDYILPKDTSFSKELSKLTNFFNGYSL